MAYPNIHLTYMSNQPSIHQTWHNINPSMLLSSCHYISSKAKACIIKSRQGDIGSKYVMSSFKALHVDLHTHIHQQKVKLIEQTHACTYERMTYLTYLTATQHL